VLPQPRISPGARGRGIRGTLGADLLALVEAGRRRTYYAGSQDQADIADYYAGLDRSITSELFNALSELLSSTHMQLPRYAPSRWVYPWVDLRPDRRLASLYSGISFEPEEFILLDAQVDEERAQRMAERIAAESPSLRAVAEIEEALEALLPYNCEHVVPQSWFRYREPMKGDLHHLFACERRCNSFRGNRSYWELAEEALMEACGRSDRTHFEPRAGHGAAARATLYFLVRYPGEIDAPNALTYEQIALLRRWSREDGVSDHERHRNQAIFEIQGNRNPFIDFPELADDVDFEGGLG
jgi:endonuclease I